MLHVWVGLINRIRNCGESIIFVTRTTKRFNRFRDGKHLMVECNKMQADYEIYELLIPHELYDDDVEIAFNWIIFGCRVFKFIAMSFWGWKDWQCQFIVALSGSYKIFSFRKLHLESHLLCCWNRWAALHSRPRRKNRPRRWKFLQNLFHIYLASKRYFSILHIRMLRLVGQLDSWEIPSEQRSAQWKLHSPVSCISTHEVLWMELEKKIWWLDQTFKFKFYENWVFEFKIQKKSKKF